VPPKARSSLETNVYTRQRRPIWLDFDPQSRREQRGRRPAVVVSPRHYNAASAMAWVCLVTSKAKGYPFEVALPVELGVQGVVLVDQLRSLDYGTRQAVKISGGIAQQILEARDQSGVVQSSFEFAQPVANVFEIEVRLALQNTEGVGTVPIS
jgi:mRNA interferase MazF